MIIQNLIEEVQKNRVAHSVELICFIFYILLGLFRNEVKMSDRMLCFNLNKVIELTCGDKGDFESQHACK